MSLVRTVGGNSPRGEYYTFPDILSANRKNSHLRTKVILQKHLWAFHNAHPWISCCRFSTQQHSQQWNLTGWFISKRGSYTLTSTATQNSSRSVVLLDPRFLRTCVTLGPICERTSGENLPQIEHYWFLHILGTNQEKFTLAHKKNINLPTVPLPAKRSHCEHSPHPQISCISLNDVIP